MSRRRTNSSRPKKYPGLETSGFPSCVESRSHLKEKEKVAFVHNRLPPKDGWIILSRAETAWASPLLRSARSPRIFPFSTSAAHPSPCPQNRPKRLGPGEHGRSIVPKRSATVADNLGPSSQWNGRRKRVTTRRSFSSLAYTLTGEAKPNQELNSVLTFFPSPFRVRASPLPSRMPVESKSSSDLLTRPRRRGSTSGKNLNEMTAARPGRAEERPQKTGKGRKRPTTATKRSETGAPHSSGIFWSSFSFCHTLGPSRQGFGYGSRGLELQVEGIRNCWPLSHPSFSEA